MYCPKCGSLNQDSAEYCRSCGYDIRVINQVLKQHLPVRLIGKLDAAIDKPFERFRRDAILSSILGAACLIAAAAVPWTEDRVAFLLIGILALLASGWSWLSYGRSITLKQQRSNSDSEYCPNCGDRNLGGLGYCRTCGMSLNFQEKPQGVERFLPSVVLSRLDRRVMKNELTPSDPGKMSNGLLAILGAIFLINVVLQSLSGSWALALVYVAITLTIVGKGAWNHVASRREAGKQADAASRAQYESADLEPDTRRLPDAPASIENFTTRPLEYDRVKTEKDR